MGAHSLSTPYSFHMAPSDFVDSKINDNACVVFSKSYCPYCDRVKALLKQLGASFEAIELDERDDCSAVQQELGKRTGATSVPRVFVGKKFIGGCDDVMKVHNQGNLQG